MLARILTKSSKFCTKNRPLEVPDPRVLSRTTEIQPNISLLEHEDRGSPVIGRKSVEHASSRRTGDVEMKSVASSLEILGYA